MFGFMRYNLCEGEWQTSSLLYTTLTQFAYIGWAIDMLGSYTPPPVDNKFNGLRATIQATNLFVNWLAGKWIRVSRQMHEEIWYVDHHNNNNFGSWAIAGAATTTKTNKKHIICPDAFTAVLFIFLTILEFDCSQRTRAFAVNKLHLYSLGYRGHNDNPFDSFSVLWRWIETSGEFGCCWAFPVVYVLFTCSCNKVWCWTLVFHGFGPFFWWSYK